MSDHPQTDESQLLRDARAKAARLMANLIAQRDDLARFAPQIAPDKRAQGQLAFANAIESTRKTLEGIDQALRHTTSHAE
ncbi:MAG: hypothetical protein JWN40_2170 [Phycisphaerales bacterium]|nr:hypothetical protein [Phycisphaerales bacterium]